MKKYLFLLILSGFCSFGFAQEVVTETRATTSGVIKQVDELPTEGTYEVIVANEDVIVNISKEQLLQINHKREVEHDAYIIINEYVKIRILPFKVIRAQGFVPLKKYSYEN